MMADMTYAIQTHAHMAVDLNYVCAYVYVSYTYITYVSECGRENEILLYFLQFEKYVSQRDILCSYAAVGRKGYFVIYGDKSSVIAVLLYMHVNIVTFFLIRCTYV